MIIYKKIIILNQILNARMRSCIQTLIQTHTYTLLWSLFHIVSANEWNKHSGLYYSRLRSRYTVRNEVIQFVPFIWKRLRIKHKKLDSRLNEIISLGVDDWDQI